MPKLADSRRELASVRSQAKTGLLFVYRAYRQIFFLNYFSESKNLKSHIFTKAQQINISLHSGGEKLKELKVYNHLLIQK